MSVALGSYHEAERQANGGVGRDPERSSVDNGMRLVTLLKRLRRSWQPKRLCLVLGYPLPWKNACS